MCVNSPPGYVSQDKQTAERQWLLRFNFPIDRASIKSQRLFEMLMELSRVETDCTALPSLFYISLTAANEFSVKV